MHKQLKALRQKLLFAFLLLSCIILFDCSGKKKDEWDDYEVLADCYADSVEVKNFLQELGKDYQLREPLVSFYQKRRFAPVWINSKGPNEYAGHFINLLNNEDRSFNSRRSDSMLTKLHSLYQEVLQYKGELCHQDSLALKLETALTMNFFEYAQRNWNGAPDEILKKVNWFIKRKKLNYEQLLANFLKQEDPHFINEPVYPQHKLLKRQLEKYYEIEMIGGWSKLPAGKLKLVKGDSSSVIPLIRQQLYVLGDLAENNRNSFYDDDFEVALKKFQKRHGLDEDGVVGGATLQALNVPVQDRIRQILINMERSRWVPVDVKGDYIIVNIPQFKMHVYTDNKLDWSCNVIVGKSNSINNTVIFNDSIEHIVFNPYWNIPKNILMMETLPSIQKDRRYLDKNNLEVVDRQGKHVSTFFFNWNKYGENFPYIIRERPGPNNSLGRVKFLFPNPYDIYLHDTPARTLFSKSSRAFSHGCIRVEQPLRLAEHLLRDNPKWDSLRIAEVLETEKETYVKLKKKVPIFLTYFTAWVDKDGEMNFREDVYQHDAKMKELLIVNQ